MGTSTKERAKLLRLRKQLMLHECPYLVIDKMGGRYDDALSLLIEVVLDGRLPASLIPKKDWHGKAINGTVDENETSIVTADIVAWMECISPNEQALAVELETVNAAQPIKAIDGAHVNFIFPDLPKLSLWDLACCLTGQNAADNIPSNLTRHKLAELVLAVYENKLWVEWPDGTDFDFLSGFINRARNRIAYTAEDRRSLDAVTVRREDWETYSAPMIETLPPAPAGGPAPQDLTLTTETLDGVEKHASLYDLVHPYINTLYDNLPVEVQDHVAKEFTSEAWNAASPNWRSGWALHDDYERKTKRTELAEAMLAYGYWIKLQDQIIEIVHKINAFKLENINSDANINYSGQDIVRLMDELSLLEGMWYKPKFSNGSPENIELEKNRGAGNLEIIEMPEAIQFLIKNTGALWTEDQLLSFVSKFQISLYAPVPPWIPINIIRHNAGGFFSRYYIEPGRNLMAILEHRLIESIWITGKVNATSACYTPPSSNSDLIFFTKPVQVNRCDVRLTTEIMLRILKEWESIQRFGAPILQTIQMPIEALPGPVTLAMPTLQSAEMQVTPVFASTPAETHAAPAGPTWTPATAPPITLLPGTIPNTSMGEVAITAAWELERELSQRPSMKQVMLRIKEWAASGERFPSVLQTTATNTQGVNWITTKGDPKNYSVEALAVCLSRWWKSRQ